MVLTMSGLEGGVSAFNVFNNSGNVTIAAGNMTGTLDIASLEVSGAGSIVVSTGTAGNFSHGTVNAAGAFTLDAAAHTSGSEPNCCRYILRKWCSKYFLRFRKR